MLHVISDPVSYTDERGRDLPATQAVMESLREEWLEVLRKREERYEEIKRR